MPKPNRFDTTWQVLNNPSLTGNVQRGRGLEFGNPGKSMKADCHVHLDGIGPPHEIAPPSLKDLRAYAHRESIALICGIYQHEEVLQKFVRAEIRIFPFFWERNPISPKIPASAKGLKLHPYMDNYVLKKENILPALLLAGQRNMHVLIHTDDRKPSLSRGRLVAALASESPDLIFIQAHSGAYAPAKPSHPGSSTIPDPLIHELVSEAIDVAAKYPNVFLEVSILASRIKAELIAERAPAEKILLGSDFPIDKSVFGSIVFQENALRQAGMPEERIEAIHRNAFRLFAS